jgi:signal transduction histidine kinase
MLRKIITKPKLLAKGGAAIPHQWALGLMLLSLHIVLVWGIDTPIQKILLVCHYGFFLLWQPIWKSEERLSTSTAIMFVGAGILAIFFINWWLIAFWLAGLFALLGGRVFSSRAKNARISYLLAAGYLLGVLLLWVVPKLLEASADIAATELAIKFLMPLVPLAILFIRAETEDTQHAPILDFFYTLLLLLLAVILMFGSFVIKASSSTNYAVVLIYILFGLAFALFIVSWLWNPRAGFAGIGLLLSRYLSSVGMPFEQWVRDIAELAETESNPKEFIQSAVREVAGLPWVSGVTWDTYDSLGELGVADKYRATFDFHGLHLTLHTPWPLTPALTLHVKLLTQILGEFYVAKRREETLQQNAYMQAVYETGSRLTHDIKNIVQSMGALCNAAEQTGVTDSEQLLALIRRQLPKLNQRLALTLDKFEAPRNEKSRRIKLSTWWNSMKQRYLESNIEFLSGQLPKIEVDAEVLDSVVDNLLQNAIEKAKNEPGLSIQAEIGVSDVLSIEVCDSGKAMPEIIAEQLFKKHISSENGLGIGLYHAARQAGQAGYLLTLVENRDGAVRFRLSRESV